MIAFAIIVGIVIGETVWQAGFEHNMQAGVDHAFHGAFGVILYALALRMRR